MAEQSEWRFCVLCTALFFAGHRDTKGICAGTPGSAGPHQPAGYNFVLPYNVSGTPNTQPEWRNCWKCQVMFFDGHADGNKGRCAQGGAHEGHASEGAFNFVLPFNLPWTPTQQTEWRNCWKCQVMFFDGGPDKGDCPAGGGHEGHANENTFNFSLPHPVNPQFWIVRDGESNGAVLFFFGSRFTPNHDVKIVYNIDSPSFTQGTLVVGTDVHGGLQTSQTIFGTGIAAQATDLVTGTVVNTTA